MNTVPVRSIAARLSQWRSRFSPSGSAHLRLGRRGERLAARNLRRQGYKILYRNFRGRRGGEIAPLVFVEVKTRTREDFGRPLEAVNPGKQRRISLGALAWLRLLGNPDILFRFDIVEVTLALGRPPRHLLVAII